MPRLPRMTNPSSITTRVRIAWALLVLGSIYALGWYKSAENHRDYRALATWRQQLKDLDGESKAEKARLGSWIRSLHSHRDAKRQIEIEFNGGAPLSIADGTTYHWMHPEYGIPVELAFNGNEIVSSSVAGSQIAQAHREPTTTYRSGMAEAFRRSIAEVLPWLWILVFIVAVVSSRHGLFAAITTLSLSLAYGCAIIVSPYYTLSVSGIFSNDRLFFAFLMYMSSIIAAAFRMPRDDARPEFRFGLRTVLVAMAILAISMAAGSFGYVALMISLPGLLAYLVVVYSFQRPSRTLTHSSQTSTA